MDDRPILVVGLAQRCGTNFLAELLLRHPDTHRPSSILEDHLPVGARRILDGVHAIIDRHPPEWGSRHGDVASRVGTALVSWVDGDGGPGRLVSKTPGAADLDALMHLCPFADVVVLARDGRDVVASGMAGLGWGFGEGTERWLEGARGALDVLGRPLRPGWRVRLARYESLVADTAGELASLLEWLQLATTSYPWDGVDDLPVYGSSYVRGDREDLHWDPVARPQGFDPRGRAAGWDAHLRARFALRAGVASRALGYDVPTPSADVATVGAAGIEVLRSARRAARRAVGA